MRTFTDEVLEHLAACDHLREKTVAFVHTWPKNEHGTGICPDELRGARKELITEIHRWFDKSALLSRGLRNYNQLLVNPLNAGGMPERAMIVSDHGLREQRRS
jgi:hypothetical protein